jgi:hypothetical protein
MSKHHIMVPATQVLVSVEKAVEPQRCYVV